MRETEALETPRASQEGVVGACGEGAGDRRQIEAERGGDFEVTGVAVGVSRAVPAELPHFAEARRHQLRVDVALQPDDVVAVAEFEVVAAEPDPVADRPREHLPLSESATIERLDKA